MGPVTPTLNKFQQRQQQQRCNSASATTTVATAATAAATAAGSCSCSYSCSLALALAHAHALALTLALALALALPVPRCGIALAADLGARKNTNERVAGHAQRTDCDRGDKSALELTSVTTNITLSSCELTVILKMTNNRTLMTTGADAHLMVQQHPHIICCIVQ